MILVIIYKVTVGAGNLHGVSEIRASLATDGANSEHCVLAVTVSSVELAAAFYLAKLVVYLVHYRLPIATWVNLPILVVMLK